MCGWPAAVDPPPKKNLFTSFFLSEPRSSVGASWRSCITARKPICAGPTAALKRRTPFSVATGKKGSVGAIPSSFAKFLVLCAWGLCHPTPPPKKKKKKIGLLASASDGRHSGHWPAVGFGRASQRGSTLETAGAAVGRSSSSSSSSKIVFLFFSSSSSLFLI